MASEKKQVNVKVGMLGDAQVGKTSLMYKYVEDKFTEDYIMTLGVTFLEKSQSVKGTDIRMMIWDLGGQKESDMLEIVCTDSYVLLFMFDLCRPNTLSSIKDWFVNARKLNKKALPFLVGTKFDKFIELPEEQQQQITDQARKFAEKMKCPLIFSSSKAGVNVKKLFKLVICKLFDLKSDVEKISDLGHPIFEY